MTSLGGNAVILLKSDTNAESMNCRELTDVALIIAGKSGGAISVALKPSCEIHSLGLGTTAKLV